MIIGDNFLADGARAAFGDPPFVWVLHHPALPNDLDFSDLNPGRLIVISTPIKVGTIAYLEDDYPRLRFAYVPENVREAHPEDWKTQARFVIGCREQQTRNELRSWFTPALFMSPESAEMVKHALNGFLALSIRYAQDIARIGRACDANPDDVAAGLMSDPRIGQHAYLRPEGTISPHLRRELKILKELDADSRDWDDLQRG